MVWAVCARSVKSRAIAPLLVLLVLVSGAGTLPGDAAPGVELAAETTDGPMKAADHTAPRTPLHFEPNHGQAHDDVLFTARAAPYTFFLTTTEAVFVTPQDVVRLGFVDGDPTATATGLARLPGVSHHFRGDDPTRWATHVPHHAEVLLAGVWPGIDILFRATPEGAVQYDFLVAPGADPDQIRIHYEGATPGLRPDGSLVLEAGAARLHQPSPYTYQDHTGRRSVIPSGFLPHADGTIGFHLGAYDPALPLIIDPVVLAYGTYLGGDGDDAGDAIAVDDDGHVYVTGTTFSVDFPTNTPMQPDHNGGAADIFLTKLTPAGDALLYSTYLGGSGVDTPRGIALDARGNAYLTGYTRSTDYPLKDPYQNRSLGTHSAFVTKVAATGDALGYSTYFGGSGGDLGRRIAVDDNGSAHIAGWTDSPDLPVQDAVQPLFGGTRDAFVTAFTPAGDALRHSTYLGGSAEDRAEGLALDSAGRVHIGGVTASTDLPVRAAYQTTKSSGWDAFMTILDQNGTKLLTSTYYGGNSADTGTGLAVGPDDSIYLIISSASTDMPALNAYQPKKDWANDAYVARFAPGGEALVYATYLGGMYNDHPRDVAIARDGTAKIIGDTQSYDFPAAGAYQSFDSPANSAFVSYLSADGRSLLFSTRHGGSDEDHGRGIALDRYGNAYIAGSTRSSDLKTLAPYQAERRGNSDAFVARIDGPVIPYPPLPPLNLTAAAGPHQIALAWEPPTDATDVTGYGIYAAPEEAGPYTRIATTPSDILSHTHQLDRTGETRHYHVVARNGTAESTPSNTASATSLPHPGEPRNLSATRGIRQITLHWEAPSQPDGPLTGYEIHAITYPTWTYTLIGTTTPETRTFTDDRLNPGQTRHYRIAAQTDNGAGPYASLSAQTLYPPNPPEDLAASPGARSVTLTWDEPPGDSGSPIVRYSVYGADAAEGPYTLLGAADAEEREYVESGLRHGQTRHYRVTAIDEHYEGYPAHVSGTSFRVPDPPSELVARPGATTGTIELTWETGRTDPMAPVLEHRLYRDDGSGQGYVHHATIDGDTLRHTDQGEPLKRYHYIMTSVNVAGESYFHSNIACSRPAPWVIPPGSTPCWLP